MPPFSCCGGKEFLEEYVEDGGQNSSRCYEQKIGHDGEGKRKGGEAATAGMALGAG